MYTYVEDILPMKKFLALVLLIIGPLILLENIFFGVFIFGIGLNMITRDGAQLDIANKKYRTVKSVLGFKFGRWKPLPDFEYISVFKTKESTSVNAYGATMGTFKSDIIVLNLFYKGNKHITFYKTDNKEEAFATAEHMKLGLDIPVLDATSSEKKWL